MNKPSLLVLSLTALSGAAFAQSSVTLFGVVDANIGYGSGSVASRTSLSGSGLNSNRLGFRGTEDLGGGLAASFWLEAGFNVDTGTGLSTNTNNQASGVTPAGGLTFNRRSTVSLSGPWGEVRMGRDYTPQYWNLGYMDVFGNVGAGSALPATIPITGPTAVRASNSIGYLSPKVLGGFAVQVAHYRGENASGAANSGDGTGGGVRLTYDNGPLTAGLGWGRTKYAAGDTYQRNVLLGWDFGVAKLYGGYSRDAAGSVNATGHSLAVSVPVGVGEFKAGYSRYKTDAAGSPDAKKLAIGYVHNLSKRSALYATLAHVTNSGGSAHALNGSITAPNGSSRGVDLGFRHAF
ncbi:putative porin precursor transmembrane protein [Delftia sp. Cs1-4]|uniref:porin n=1 Tax=Delftia sp. (strain Cs1-4) TaxID=742013 RepID=UPI00020E7982|nr:porin [Delftia sp. Cs1-4]AEF88682.1 putative porin precursor transmembrane protein [Delftia sp. Cs1-4]